MPKSTPVKIEEHELKEPKWRLRRHKQNLSYMCIRMDQLLKAMEKDDIDQIEALSKIIRVTVKNLDRDGIGIYETFPEEEE